MNSNKFHFSSLNTHDRGLFIDEWQNFLITNNHNVRFVQ